MLSGKLSNLIPVESVHQYAYMVAMPAEPRTIRESNFVVSGLEARLGLVLKMVWGVIALLGTLLAGAGALYVQIGELKTDAAVIKSSIVAINAKLAEIETVGTRNSNSLVRIENKLGIASVLPEPPQQIAIGPTIRLTEWEIAFVLSIISPDAKPAKGKYVLGDLVPEVWTCPGFVER